MSALETSQSKLSRLEAAQTLEEVAQTLDAAPLQSHEELKAFYKGDVQKARGIDRMRQMRISLGDAYSSQKHFKTFLSGHPGVGKTTELSHLLGSLATQWRPLRMSVALELNPGTLKHYDILLLILMRLIKEVLDIKPESSDELEGLLKLVKEQLAEKWTKRIGTSLKEWGGGINIGQGLAKVFSSLKQGVSEEQGTREYEVSFVSELVDLVNQVLEKCSVLLFEHNRTKWVLVLEDIEKLGSRPEVIREVFIGLRAALERFASTIVITIPPWLGYGDDTNELLPVNFTRIRLPDVAVYAKDHEVDSPNVEALESVVLKRMKADLMENGVLRACVVSSGGNLRDLFQLLLEANLNARARGADRIGMEDAKSAVNSLRYEYRSKLGATGRYDSEIQASEKLERLAKIYEHSENKLEFGDRVLYHLLQHRCVLEFNGEGWFGVHPLVVDLLIQNGSKPFTASSKGGSGFLQTK
jgi:hypothetical protein